MPNTLGGRGRALIERMSLSGRRRLLIVLIGLYTLTPAFFVMVMGVAGDAPLSGVRGWLSFGLAFTASAVIPFGLLVLVGYVAASADLPGSIWSVLAGFLLARLVSQALIFWIVGGFGSAMLKYLLHDNLSIYSLPGLIPPLLVLAVVFMARRQAIGRRNAAPRPLA